MTPTRPYFLRAVYEWIIENSCTPYLAVNATGPEVQVPQEHIIDGKIILNLAPEAINNLFISNKSIDFSARFSGVPKNIYVPMESVLGIYAKENGQGMAFPADEYEASSDDENPKPDQTPPRQSGGRPSLKVVK